MRFLKVYFTITYFNFKRPGCNADDKYQFTCPHFGLYQRFGDHDRLPHPTDCKFYYACLRNGLPRLLSCQKPQVFNPESGFCDHHENVQGCQGYYPPEEELDLEDRKSIINEVREQLLKDYGFLLSKSRSARSLAALTQKVVSKKVRKCILFMF